MTAAIDISNYDTDKSAAYLSSYEREFGHLFDQSISLLELGIQRGGSMLLWLDLLPSAQIAGLDLNPVELPTDERLHIYQGFQQDTVVLDRIAAEVAPDGFDIIIDDASHLGRYTAESFWHLFPRHLKAGGVYVIDDWGSGYWDSWADGHCYTGSREALGDFNGAAPASPGRGERIRRRVRAGARPWAAKLGPRNRKRLERLYMRAEGSTVQTRFESHDYGMVGFIKQLVDACAVSDIDRGRRTFDNSIAEVHVMASQVFVHKGESVAHDAASEMPTTSPRP
jgi:hypothetical protein